MLKKLFTVRNLVILLGVIALFVISGMLGLEVTPPHVSLAAETLFYIGNFPVTNALFTTWIVMIILIVIAILATRRHPKDLANAKNSELVPSGIGNVMEMLVEGFYGFTESVAGRWVSKFFPIVMTLLLIIVLSNWVGLLPGVGTIGFLEHSEDGHGYVANGVVMTAEEAHGDEGVILVPFFRAAGDRLELHAGAGAGGGGLDPVLRLQGAEDGLSQKVLRLQRLQTGRLHGGDRRVRRPPGA